MSRQHDAVANAPKVKKHTIKLDSPGATCVAVTGSFCGWTPEGCRLKRDDRGIWKVSLTLAPGRYEYRFRVDGQWEDDPKCTDRVPNPFGSENGVFAV